MRIQHTLYNLAMKLISDGVFELHCKELECLNKVHICGESSRNIVYVDIVGWTKVNDRSLTSRSS